ncbi:MAG: PilZ domain-containing protein [Candidatus Omnitrophica bacterium]|nr:PilZ domain-containing protein [Candidatus Omnitrophota bacterium]
MERRHVGRVKTALPVTCVFKGAPEKPCSGTTWDLSQGGVSAILPRSLPKESYLNLKIQTSPTQIVEAEGVVVWQYHVNGIPSENFASGYLTGIQFSRILESGSDIVAKLVMGARGPADTRDFGRRTVTARIAHTASFLPDKIVTNDHIIANGLKSTDLTIQRALGAIERRSVQPGQNASSMMAEVAKAILTKAKRHPSTIDMIICAVNPGDAVAPDVGSTVQVRIGAHCPAFEINMSCSGWLCAVDIARRYIAGGHKAILVLAASTVGSSLPFKSLMHRAIFGDGAGGILLEADSSGEGDILACELWNRGEYGTHIFAPLPWTVTPPGIPDEYKGYFYMNPAREEFFQVMDRHLIPFVNRTLRKARVSIGDIDVFLLHYPSKFLFEYSLGLLGVPQNKVVENFSRYGNLVSAELPVLLDENMRAGRIKRGQLVLMFTYGAGFTSACAVVRL